MVEPANGTSNNHKITSARQREGEFKGEFEIGGILVPGMTADLGPGRLNSLKPSPTHRVEIPDGDIGCEANR